MFRNRASRDTLLPHSGNGRGGGGGLYGTARMSPKASLSKSFIATMVWALVSVSMIGGGWLYCSRRMQYTRVKCDLTHCDVEELSSGVTTLLTIPHSQMVRAELSRLKNGKMVNPADLRRSLQRKLGHTYSLVYLEPDSEDDDDESYDSFEDDDDSFDSYDDDQDSSEEDEDEEGPAAAARGKRPPAAAKKPAATKLPDPVAQAKARDLHKQKMDEKRRKFAEEREREGKKRIEEPDVAAKAKAKANANTKPRREDSGERFPGDAGTMREKNRAEIRKMEAAQGMTAEGHQERSQKAYEEASKKAQARQQMDAQMRQMGNNLHDRATPAKPKPKPNADKNKQKVVSPDDPDSKKPADTKVGKPKLERQKAVPDLNVDAKGTGVAGAAKGAGVAGADKNGQKDQKGGGRKTSSVGGLEDVGGNGNEDEDEIHRRRLASNTQKRDNQGEGEGSVGEAQGGGLESLGEFVQAGARGARRQLLGWKNRVKNVNPAPAKRTKEEVRKDAEEARNSHRKGRGHHNKRAKKVAHPIQSDGDGEIIEEKPKTKHHHRGFHHKKDVPMKDRHHVHHGFHHQPGEKKIEHGWRHQNRQWHGHKEIKKLGTTYSLGRTVARKRKETIDSYVSRRTTSVDFTDAKKWRAGGLWIIILGCISAAFCIVIGNFQPRPKNKKVS